MPLDVICVGVATVDTIATVKSMPGEDERIVAEPFLVAGGGPAATAAVALARLGVAVGFCGVVGDDDAGLFVRDLLEREGIDTSWIVTSAGTSTPQSMIIVSRNSQSRTIVTTPSHGPRPEHVPTEASRWLHVDQTGYASTRAALRSRRAAVSLSIDGGNPIEELDLEGVELYAPTTASLARIFPATNIEESLRAAARAGARQVVATASGDGSYVLVDGDMVLVQPYPVETVSTMGAGDVFHGAVLAGLVEGRSLVCATRRANAVAALSCRALDGRSGIPDAATTEEFMAAASAAQLVRDRS
jgi:sulfofructose kinase